MDPMLEGASWLDEELAGSTFADARLGQRLRRLLEQLGGAMGASLPLACQDWAATKAAYRFFDNDRVSEAEILAGHFAATASRVAATEGPILILHDTTEFTYHRVRPEPIGLTGQYPCRNTSYDRRQLYTVCGLLMHSSLGVTPDGLPLGLCAIKFWTRASFKGTTELKRHINPTRVPIEDKESLRWLENMRQSSALVADPARCIHIGDRESDIYELFVTAHELARTFSCAAVSTGGRMTAPRRSSQPWTSSLPKVSIGSRCVTTTASRARRTSPSSTTASRCCRLSPSGSAIPRSRSP